MVTKQETITFKDLYQAYKDCRKHKRGTANAQRYEMHLLDNLFQTRAALQARDYSPSHSIHFVVKKPKAREIYAANFRDRVVHHWLVKKLEKLFEPIFIYDVYSNRNGKGTHKAVARVQSFIHANGSNAGYLQLDIANFFNSIDCPILFRLIQQRLSKAIKQEKISINEADTLRWLCHVLLKHDTTHHAHYRGDPALLNTVPQHKRLATGGTNKGLPIGNLTSQFFANIYMNPLDQYIKHQLKCRHYVRYVDDFILLSNNPDQLIEWNQQIIHFLHKQLLLKLRESVKPQLATQGIDFLGYIIHPHHKLVRRRVVGNLREKLSAFQRKLLQGQRKYGYYITFNKKLIESLQATLSSYWGHFHHANSYRLRQGIIKEFPWLYLLIEPLFEFRQKIRLCWQPHISNIIGYKSQVGYFQKIYPNAAIHIQRGTEIDVFIPTKSEQDNLHCAANNQVDPSMIKYQVQSVIVREFGYLKGGLKCRRIYRLFMQSGVEISHI